MKTYIGTVTDMDWQVLVKEKGVNKSLPLCLEHINHSPDGFAWGYVGSGPAQLSFAILNDSVGTEKAKLYYHSFQKIISRLPKETSFEMSIEEVKLYVTAFVCNELLYKQQNSWLSKKFS